MKAEIQDLQTKIVTDIAENIFEYLTDNWDLSTII